MYKPKIIYKEIVHPVSRQKQDDMAFFYKCRKPNQPLFLVYTLSDETTETTKEWHLNVSSAPNKNIMQNPNKNQLNKIGSAIFTYNVKIDKNCWLTHIYVNDDFQGRKIGSHLLGLANALTLEQEQKKENKMPNWKIACLRSYDSVVGYALSNEGTILINSYMLRHPTFSYRVILPKDQIKNDDLPIIQTEFIPPNIIKENSVEYANSLDSTDSKYDNGKKPPPELLATFYNAQGELLCRQNKLYEAYKMFEAASKKTNVKHRVYGRIYTNIYHTLHMLKMPHEAEDFKQKFIKRLEDKLKNNHAFYTRLLINSYLEQIKDRKKSKSKLKHLRNMFEKSKTSPQKKKRKLKHSPNNNLPQQTPHAMMRHHV